MVLIPGGPIFVLTVERNAGSLGLRYMKVYQYIRVSGKAQVDKDGPDRQRQAVSEFITLNKLVFAGEFFEQGVSGTVEGMDRPQFSEMIAYCETRDVKAIVVERLDRLARDLMVQEIMLAECRKAGISVFSVDQGKAEDIASNGADPTRILIRQIMGALAQWEKSVIVKKLKAARDRKKAETGRCEGTIPYGTSPSERAILMFVEGMLPPDYVPTICKPGVRTPDGTLSFGGVAKLLNDAGFQTRKGTDWNRRTVRSIWVNNIKRKTQ